MTIVQINATASAGSTGKITLSISRLLQEEGIENYILYSHGKTPSPNAIRFMGEKEGKLNALSSRVLGNYGFNARSATKRLIQELETIKPDIVHLHNLHSHDVHLAMLFRYFKNKKTKLYWTFHDCWAFTAYCPYFDMADCQKWKKECHHCSQRNQFSWFFDRSKVLHQRKKELFSGLDLTIITPSAWLADLVQQSFLADYPVKVINNGIDLDLFCPRESDFRQKHGLSDKFVLLGVAFGWGKRKGLDVFQQLAERLDDRFAIVLVGTNDQIDQTLPNNILSIHRTENQEELAALYTAADLFVNPTREENYPTVNMESLACGTPVLTFDTGGSAEMVDASCGAVVPRGDVDQMIQAILSIEKDRPFSQEACLEKAKDFDAMTRYREYVSLYGMNHDKE